MKIWSWMENKKLAMVIITFLAGIGLIGYSACKSRDPGFKVTNLMDCAEPIIVCIDNNNCEELSPKAEKRFFVLPKCYAFSIQPGGCIEEELTFSEICVEGNQILNYIIQGSNNNNITVTTCDKS